MVNRYIMNLILIDILSHHININKNLQNYKMGVLTAKISCYTYSCFGHDSKTFLILGIVQTT